MAESSNWSEGNRSSHLAGLQLALEMAIQGHSTLSWDVQALGGAYSVDQKGQAATYMSDPPKDPKS